MSVKSDLVFTRSYLVLSKSHLNDQNLPTLFFYHSRIMCLRAARG